MTDSISDQFAEHQRVISVMLEDARLLERIAERIVECFDSGGKLLLLGNGGSAADAQHIAAELVGLFKHDRRALPACDGDRLVETARHAGVPAARLEAVSSEALYAKLEAREHWPLLAIG